MIISHKHRFIFIAVPKTATQAVREALSTHLDEGDWQQQALFGKDLLPIPELAAVGHGHLSVRQVQPYLSDEMWRSYFKFAFVRQPYDRFVSACFFLFRNDPAFREEATRSMRRALDRPRFRQRVLVRPQSSLLVDENGELAIDFVGRFEDLQRSYDEACANIGIPSMDLRKKNPSSHRPYVEYYDAELERQVAEFYREDFRRFGYSPDLSASSN